MLAVVVPRTLSEARARAIGDALLADERVAEALLCLEPSDELMLFRREGSAAPVRFAARERDAAFDALHSGRVAILSRDDVRLPADVSGASHPDAVLAAPAAVPSDARGFVARAVRLFGRVVCGIDPALLAASWCVLPRRVAAAAVGAGFGPGLIPCVVARSAPCSGVPVVAYTAAPDARYASALSLTLALCRGIGYAFLSARAGLLARGVLVLAMCVALGGLVQKSGEVSRRAILTAAEYGLGATRWGIPAEELRAQLPTAARVFAIVEPRPAHFRTDWFLRNCLSPRSVVCGEEHLVRDPSLVHVVMRFGDPARETEFCTRYGIRITARCAHGYAVGRRGQ